MVRRTRIGSVVSPTPGSSITIAPTRPKVSRKAAASAGRKEMSMRIRLLAFPHRHGRHKAEHDGGEFASSRNNAGGDSQHLGVQLLRHERQRDEQRDEDRENLRHESNG